MLDKICIAFKSISRNVVRSIAVILIIFSVFFSNSACTKSGSPIDASMLVEIGDTLRYGSYLIYKLDEGVYKLNDPGITTGSGGAFGVDMFLICGEKKALMIDLGNNFIEGKEGNGIAPRKNAAEELRELLSILVGKVPLEIALTHAHGDHTGMISAFVDRNVPIWKSNIENEVEPPKPESRRQKSSIDLSKAYTLFSPGEKTFDLGGGRIVETFAVKGHSNDGVVYILKKDGMLFTGDAFGCGNGPALESAKTIKDLADDSKKFVDDIKDTWKPYERYAMRVYVGHTWNNIFNAYYSPDMELVDLDYLDWRFIQNTASCAKEILEGKWLVKGSGLIYVMDMPASPYFGKKTGWAVMVHGLGTIMLPIKIAYEAAGIPVPDSLAGADKLEKIQK